MKQEDAILHTRIHEAMMRMDPENIFTPRVNVFEKVEGIIKRKVGGVVLDVGCGSGYASIWLAKNRQVTKAYALEASEQAVDYLLPRNISYHNVGHIVEPVQGSFDNIPFADAMDFVVAFGALHHSPCLWSTMQSVSRALKEGGYLIAQEPVMANTTTNAQYIDKHDIIEERFGVKVRNGDRDDHFFREAEYITAAAFSSLDLIACKTYVPLGGNRLKSTVKRILASFRPSTQGRGSGQTFEDRRMMRPHRKIWVFIRRKVDYIPHKWKPLLRSDELRGLRC